MSAGDRWIAYKSQQSSASLCLCVHVDFLISLIFYNENKYYDTVRFYSIWFYFYFIIFFLSISFAFEDLSRLVSFHESFRSYIPYTDFVYVRMRINSKSTQIKRKRRRRCGLLIIASFSIQLIFCAAFVCVKRTF